MRQWRIVVAAVGGLVMLSTTACQTIDGTASAPSDQVSAYLADESAAAAVRSKVQAITLCEQAIPSMAAMVREYNAFISALNKTHDYAKIRGLDTKAREQLASGANEIRPKLTDDVPADLAASVREFLAAGASLNNLIGAKQSSELNAVAQVWTRERQTTIDNCARYIPAAATSSKPVPTSSGPSSTRPPGSN